MDKKVAVIDLGTNTFHMLFAEWDGTQYNIIYRERLAVKLGMGGINNGIITDAGIDRALAGLKKFKFILRNAGISRVLAMGTSALRNAKNGNVLTERIRRETGIEVRIISGDEEAIYICSGVRKALKIGDSASLIVDIGGGSVEFIIANDQEIFWKQSFEIGAQRLLERYHQHDPILPEEVFRLNAYFDESLKSLFEAIHKFRPAVLIGSSGTFDTLSEIHCIRQGVPITSFASETPLTFESCREIFADLFIRNRAERMQIPGMIEMRVDMIVVACCLIAYLLDHAQFERLRVSSYSLKEGVLAALEER